MELEEREICIYLRSLPGQFTSGREIARRAGGKLRYRENPQWAAPFLAQLIDKKIIESDSTGHYRLIVKDQEKHTKKKWVSPQMKMILERSDKSFTHIIPDEDLPEEF
jgi:hypothetical protein